MTSSEDEREYHQLRGEYLSVAASLEYSLAWLIAYYLELGEHEKFRRWFNETTISFRSRVELFDTLITLDDGWRDPNIADLPRRMLEVHRVRNLIGHSFRMGLGSMTARGRDLPEELENIEHIKELLEEAKKVENLIGDLLDYCMIGPIGPISADDYADWPL